MRLPEKVPMMFDQKSPKLPEERLTAPLHARGVAPLPLTPEDGTAGHRRKVRDDFPGGDKWERLFEIFEQLQNGMTTLAERLWSEIPTNIFEWGYLASATGVTSGPSNGFPTLSSTTSELEYITSVLAMVPSGDTGIIQLGDVSIPVGQGTSFFAPVKFPLFPKDIRALTVTPTAGPVGLYLFGQVAPTRGKLPL